MQLTLTLQTSEGEYSVTFEHDQLPQPLSAVNGWIAVTNTTLKITMKPGEDPQSWHPGVAFRIGGQLTGDHDDLFQLTFRPADPEQRYQIGCIDVVQLDDRQFEHSKAELIVEIAGKEGAKKVRFFPVPALR